MTPFSSYFAFCLQDDLKTVSLQVQQLAAKLNVLLLATVYLPFCLFPRMVSCMRIKPQIYSIKHKHRRHNSVESFLPKDSLHPL